MDRLALSLLGVMVWEEWMNVAICVGDIEMLDKAPSELAGAKASMWTICRCSTNPHPHHAASAPPTPPQSSRSGRARLFLFQFVSGAHDSNADRPDAWLHTSPCSNSWWFVCHYSSYFPNSVFTPTPWFNTSSAGCTFPLCCGWW